MGAAPCGGGAPCQGALGRRPSALSAPCASPRHHSLQWVLIALLKSSPPASPSHLPFVPRRGIFTPRASSATQNQRFPAAAFSRTIGALPAAFNPSNLQEKKDAQEEAESERRRKAEQEELVTLLMGVHPARERRGSSAGAGESMDRCESGGAAVVFGLRQFAPVWRDCERMRPRCVL